MGNNNSIINSLKRLERVGGENSRVTQKLKAACVDTADQIIDIIHKSEIFDTNLSYDQISRLYRLTGEPKSDGLCLLQYNKNYFDLVYYEEYEEDMIITDNYKGFSLRYSEDITRSRALKFSHDVANGLLDKIAVLIERKKTEVEKAQNQIEV